MPSRRAVLLGYGDILPTISFPCHTSEKSPANSKDCHTSKTHLRKSFACHTSKPPGGARAFPRLRPFGFAFQELGELFDLLGLLHHPHAEHVTGHRLRHFLALLRPHLASPCHAFSQFLLVPHQQGS